jgi:hypothetical protein
MGKPVATGRRYSPFPFSVERLEFLHFDPESVRDLGNNH